MNAYGKVNGLALTIISPGHIKYTMRVTKAHLATTTTIHGGVMAAMMDAILGVAALSMACEEDKLVSTVEFKINYLAPVLFNSVLIGEGNVIQKGKRIIISDGSIRVDGSSELVAKGLGTFSAYPLSKSKILDHLTDTQKEILGEAYFPTLK